MVKRALIVLLFAATALANDLSVDKRSLPLNDTLTITVSLEGEFAKADALRVPLQNLAMMGEPWVSSEFSWINGEVVRRKVFRYRARPVHAGPAVVGPILVDSGEQRVTLQAIGVQILPDRASSSNDAETVMSELRSTGRDPFFIVAEADKTSAFVGEQIVVTWTLYNAAHVQQWQISGVPKLEDFWTEEIDVRRESPKQDFVGGLLMQRLPIRRVAIFPLRSGRFRIGGMSLDAAVMRRARGGPFSVFEGNMVEVAYTSAPIEIDVKPLPPGPPASAIGEVTLDCAGPDQRNGGPVVVTATLSGSGNLRAATAPTFATPIGGNVQVEPGNVTVTRGEDAITMSRRWRYLIFPAQAGLMEIPPLTMTVFSPSTGTRRELRCASGSLVAEVAAPQRASDVAPEVRRDVATRRALPWIAGGVLAALFFGVAIPRIRRERRLRRAVRELAHGTPAEIRERVEARLGVAPSALLVDRTERGDAYRAIRSILDAMERDRDVGGDVTRELTRRIRDVLTIVQ